MAQTYNVAKLNEVAVNSQDDTLGEIRTSDIDEANTDWSVEIAENETDPEGQVFFTVSRMTGSIVVKDYDFLFVDTMNNGDTVETAMVNRQTVYVQLDLEGGTLQDSSGNTWFQIRPVTAPMGDVSTDDSLLKPSLSFTHSDFGGVQRL
jgi:hypothetical protein